MIRFLNLLAAACLLGADIPDAHAEKVVLLCKLPSTPAGSAEFEYELDYDLKTITANANGDPVYTVPAQLSERGIVWIATTDNAQHVYRIDRYNGEMRISDSPATYICKSGGSKS
jgi:hypothetical protein